MMMMMNDKGACNVEPCMPCMITWKPPSSLNSLTHYDDHEGSLAGESPVVMIIVKIRAKIIKFAALTILIIHIRSIQKLIRKTEQSPY